MANMVKPFLKWVSGKTQLLPKLREFYSPGSFRAYREPFLGGGAVFFDFTARGLLDRASGVYLTDLNDELTSAYRAVRDSVDAVIAAFREHDRMHGEDARNHYYQTRAAAPSEPVAKAARTIYLNKTCFNGLYRVNRGGGFNVPMGRYKNPTICDEDNLRAASAAPARATIDSMHFRGLREEAQFGDFVYLDPPYVPTSATANFTSYTAGQFGPAEQRELADLFRKLDKRGCLLLLSNSDVPETRELYRDFHVRAVEARRSVNSVGDKRGWVGEIIVANDRLMRLTATEKVA
jgi:DNA adenine methylase